MNPSQIFIIFTAIALVTSAQPDKRNVPRLVGGHLKAPDQTLNDAELLDAQSSGSNKEKKKGESDGGAVEEERKTLSQQVADGKYGLIQKELFKKPLKQPGIISYDANPEVPKDNINNLGGLSKEDIWLAENHLLVIKGGTYPKHSDKFDNNPLIWPSIDNYTAPKRPVKIPSHPKVPPPFPVQLTDDGPLQILGANSTRTLDGPPSLYAAPLPEGGYVPGTGPYFPPYPNQADPTAGRAPHEDPSKTKQGEGQGGRPPYPTSLNGTSPPFFAHLPPGAVAVPPSINDFDEDDPSIYYPPPYSFSYPSKDNSSDVPAGPLVPGIILPPPPDFFAPLEEATKKAPPQKRPTKRPKVQKTTQQSPQIHPTTTPIPPTSVINITLRKPIKVVANNPTEINNELKPIVSTTPISKPQRITTRPTTAKTNTPRRNVKRPSVTILKPVKTVQSHRTFYNPVPPSGNPFSIYGPPRTTIRPKTISTQVPLSKHYYSTTDDINSNVVTAIPERATAPPSNFYYYEVNPNANVVTSTQSNKLLHNFFNLPDQYYENPRQVQQPRTKYVYVTSKPFNTPRPRYNQVRQKSRPTSFNTHLEKLREQIDYYSSPRPVFREIQSPKPVYQYSFQASNYKPLRQNNFRPSQPDSPADDEEGFKPIPRYSVQIQQALQISTDQSTPYPPQNPIYFKQSFRATSERPLEQQRYYSTSKPKYVYNREQIKENNVVKSKPEDSNRDYRGFFIKPDEDSYYEDLKNKPIDFGQRLLGHTTPLPETRYSTRSPKLVYVTASSNSHRSQKPISLEGDTRINYINPRPSINPDAELIHVEPPQSGKYPNYLERPVGPYNHNLQQNYNGRRPQILEAIPISVPNEDARRGSFISYSLPGNNGAHFYFLTPQLAQSRDQGADFYYSQRDSERIRRNNRGGNKR